MRKFLLSRGKLIHPGITGWSAAFIILNLLDCLATTALLEIESASQQGMFSELNPVFTAGGVPLKMGLAIVVAYLFGRNRGVMFVLTAVMMFVVAWLLVVFQLYWLPL